MEHHDLIVIGSGPAGRRAAVQAAKLGRCVPMWTELVHIGQAVINLKGGLDYFIENTFNYPTLAEAYKVAALDAWNRMGAALQLAKAS